jgi:WD40 repeat protein
LNGHEILNLRGNTLGCHSLAFDPKGNRLASSGGDATIRIWDATPLQGNEAMESINRDHEHEVWSVAYSPDGSLLASATWGGTLRLWEAQSGVLSRTVTAGDVQSLFRVAFNPEGTRIAGSTVSRDRLALVKVWDTLSGKDVLSIREKSVFFFVTYDPTGRYLVREGPDHTVQVRNAKTGEAVGVLGRHDGQIWGMAFSPDGRQLATASNDGTVRVWPWTPEHLSFEQQPKLQLPVRRGGYGHRVAFSADSQYLATGGEGQAVTIWNASTGAVEFALSGHTGDVFTLAFSPDGRWLASAGEDTTIRLWATRSWKLLHTLRGHTGVINTLAFSPDSRYLTSGSRDRTMKIWDLERLETNSEP